MSTISRRSASARPIGVAQLVVGVTTALLPRRIALLAGGTPPPELVVRVLGLRQAVQGVALVVRPTRRALTAGAAVDAVHAASLVPLIALSSRYRPAATLSSALALAAAVLQARARGSNELH